MPVYGYRPKEEGTGCEHCSNGFETKQRITDAALEKCPECQTPIERILFAVGLCTRGCDKSLLSDSNIKKHGFSKLVNEGGGKFRQTV